MKITPQSVYRIVSKLNLTKREIVKDIGNIYNIPNFSNYIITSDFQIIRKKDNVKISLSENNDGYITLKLTDDEGKRRTLQYHRVLATVFYPITDLKDKLQVNHIDGNKKNNNLFNLEWCTPSQNQKHAYDNGLKKFKTGNSKYTNEEIHNVCKLLELHKSPKKVFDLVNGEVNLVVIQQIHSKRRWVAISKEYNF